MEKIVLQLGNFTVEFPNGFSFSVPTFEVVKAGWVVPIPNLQNLKGFDGLREAIVVGLETSRNIMGWMENNETYWEVVMVFPTEDIAMFAAKKAKQQMIYQIETGKVKWLF